MTTAGLYGDQSFYGLKSSKTNDYSLESDLDFINIYVSEDCYHLDKHVHKVIRINQSLHRSINQSANQLINQLVH